MKLLRLIISISLLSLGLGTHLYAAQTAVVSTPQAIVYADQNLTSPIGFIRNGKKIRVGDIKRKRGTILPIVVSGRVAYIQVKDLALSSFDEDKDEGPKKARITEHEIDELFEKTEDKLNKNNFLVLDLGRFDLGADWELLESDFDVAPQTASSLKILFEHRPPFESINWGLGLGYYSLSGENLQFQAFTIEGMAYWIPLRFRYFSVALKGGFIISGALGVKASTLGLTNQPTGELESNSGNMFGFEAGGQVNILPYSKFGINAGISLKKLTLSGLDPIETPNNREIDLNTFSGFSLHAGLSYKF